MKYLGNIDTRISMEQQWRQLQYHNEESQFGVFNALLVQDKV